MQKRTFTQRFVELVAPLFLLSLALLLLNDFWWKQAFHNSFTGKLSDFAGLFAFSWVVLTIVRKWKWHLVTGIAITFIWWKSSLSQGFIESWNAIPLLPIQRVVDYADLMALVVLPFAAWRFGKTSKSTSFESSKASLAVRLSILTLALFSFCATSYMDGLTYNQMYSFDLPIEDVVARFNQLEKQYEFGNPTIGLAHENANDFVDEGNYRLYFHHNDESVTAYDTVYGQIEDSIFVDQIHPYTVPALDTAYVSPEGLLLLKFDIADKEIDGDKISGCTGIRSILELKSEGDKCQLKLIEIKTENCPDIGNGEEISQGEYLQQTFEKNFINPLEGNKK